MFVILPTLMENKSLFWADSLADKIISRKKYHFLDKEIKKPDVYTVKTSASLSGVLHIGRLSDSIRGDSVFRALKDKGVKARLIWVAEDMDPLRKIPKGVPKEFEQYIGMPVTKVPDPFGCHDNYAEHFKDEYMKDIKKFLHGDVEIYSMSEEYKKGTFKPFIKKAVEHAEEIRQILNKYRDNKLPEGWSPWKPICKKCGKLETTKVLDVKNGKVHYVCEDYHFKSSVAKGCGYEGWADPLKDEGKLMWKTEWAAQWALWGVNSEGGGKEYAVPNSAFWINAEISEKIFDHPMPEPIFYEHLLVDNVKMSASLGNVVYPRDWLEVAPPELLRFFYNKRLMKTRSFSWKDLPLLYDDYDKAAGVYFGKIKLDNEREEAHLKRLYEISSFKPKRPLKMSFSYAIIVSQVTTSTEDVVRVLKKTGHYQEEFKDRIFKRLSYAKNWVVKYAPDRYRFELQENPQITLSKNEKMIVEKVIAELKSAIKNNLSDKELHQKFYELCKTNNIKVKDFFKLMYRILLNKDFGPKLASFLLMLGGKAVLILEKSLN